jgi:hypothetical protein
MKYSVRNKIGGDFFSIEKNKDGKHDLDYYLLGFEKDDYWMIKNTNKFRLLDETELHKYAGIVFFKKSMFSLQYIVKWLDFTKLMDNKFLIKPFPPTYILSMIKIIERI